MKIFEQSLSLCSNPISFLSGLPAWWITNGESLEYAASDRAAFLEQKNEANGRKTMKSYLRKVCGDLYDAQHQG